MVRNNGHKWTIATIGVITTLVLTLGGLIWAAATKNTYAEATRADVKELRTKVDDHTRRLTILETRQTEIYEGVRRIEQKLDALH